MFPRQFHAKAKVEIDYDYAADTPMLFLMHYDYPNRRTREDVYYLTKDKPERFYTSLSFYDRGQSYRIFHRIRKPNPLPSPHGCMITPLTWDLLAPTHFVDAPTIFKGTKNVSVTVRLRSKKRGTPEKKLAVECYHWRTKWGGDVYDYFESVKGRRPVRVERGHMNATFLHFEAGHGTNAANLYDPHAMTSVSCSVMGGDKTRKRSEPPVRRHTNAERRKKKEEQEKAPMAEKAARARARAATGGGGGGGGGSGGSSSGGGGGGGGGGPSAATGAAAGSDSLEPQSAHVSAGGGNG